MGREIRRVTPNWEHPKKEYYDPFTKKTEHGYVTMYDQSCEEAWREWQEEYRKWVEGEFAKVLAEYGEKYGYKQDQPYTAFCTWNGPPPDPERYRPQWEPGEATWYQVYETVSEGTPTTPPFATKEELIDYLVAYGEGGGLNGDPWPRKHAEVFVNGPGWAPSLVVTQTETGVAVRTGVQELGEQLEKKG